MELIFEDRRKDIKTNWEVKIPHYSFFCCCNYAITLHTYHAQDLSEGQKTQVTNFVSLNS